MILTPFGYLLTLIRFFYTPIGVLLTGFELLLSVEGGFCVDSKNFPLSAIKVSPCLFFLWSHSITLYTEMLFSL